MAGILDTFDPLDFDPLLKAARARRAAQPWRQPATPEEAESIGKQALGLGLTGMSYALSTLDKPARAVRGLLGGKPQEALAALPFSDTLGITDPANQVTGAQLNRKFFGLKDDNSWRSWGAGLGTEILTDPLMYATLGPKAALTAAGKAAKAGGLTRGMTRAQLVKGFDYGEDALRAAGRTPDEIAHLGRQGKTIAPAGSGLEAGAPLAGLVRVGIPGSGLGATLGTGRVGQAIAPVLDKLAEAITYKVPGMKTLSGLFDSNVKRAVSEEMQKGMRKYGTPAIEAGEASGREQVSLASKEIHDLLAAGHPEADVLRALGMRAETVVPSSVLPVDPAVWAAVDRPGARLNQMGKDWLHEAQVAGVPQGELKDPYVEYFARQANAAAPGGPQMRGGNLTPLGHGSMVRRKDPLREFPGGTAMFERWATDPALSGPARTATFSEATDRILQDMTKQAGAQGLAVTPEMEKSLAAKAKQVARRLGRLDPAHAAEGRPFFDPNIVGAVDLRAARQAKVMGSAKAITGTLGETARPMEAGMVPLTDLLGRGKLDLRTRVDAGGIEGGLVELHKALARQGAGPTEAFIEKLMDPVRNAATPEDAAKALREAKRQLKAEVGRFGVTSKQAGNILQDYGKWVAPHEVVAPIKGFDTATQLFRNLAYSVWLPSHVRNLTGGVVQSGAQTAPGLQDYVRMGKLLLTNNPADEALKRDMFKYGKIFSGFNAAETQAGRQAAGGIATPPGGMVTPPVPGSEKLITPRDLGSAALQSGRQLINPKNWLGAFGPGGALEQVGVAGGQRNFPWLEAGRRLGSNVEDFLRGSQYLGQVRKGTVGSEAGRNVLRTHFDYGGLTPFERKVMRRAIPFYTFASRNLPLQLETLATRPGAIVPQLRLAAARNNQFIPEYLASGVAIPTGPEQGGNQQFISQLGIPVEEAFDRLKIKPGDPMGSITNTAMAYLGGLNPLIKAPLEQLSNRQFFTGRNLSDLRPQGTVGALGGFLDPDRQHPQLQQLAAQALANSPLTRFVTQLDKLADPRKSAVAKALNLTTGVRISDVDMEKSRAIETRKVLEGILRSNPAISQHMNLYVRPEDQARLSPEDVQRLQVLARLQSNAQLAAQRRRLADQFPPG